MREFDIKWIITGTSRIASSTIENAIERIELMETSILVSLKTTPTLEFEIKEVGEVTIKKGGEKK